MRIQTLGGLRAFLDDEPLALPPSRQSRALLAYLACSTRPVHRSSLCSLLWEDHADPRAALRWCLSRLRPVLDAGDLSRLVADADTLRLVPEACEVDSQRLRAMAAGIGEAGTREIEETVARLGGAFLADLELADALRFESWRTGEEKSLAQARGALFAELLKRHRDDPEAAVRTGHQWVQQDPLDARPHIAILEALAALGRRREALAHFERCAKLLRTQGGGLPAALEKARAALGRIGGPERGMPAPEGPGASPAPSPRGGAAGNRQDTPYPGSAAGGALVPGRPPLAGRRREMEAFSRLAAAAAAEPDPRLHLLQGEPGIGKTRLLEEVGQELAGRGWLRLRGRAFEAERGRPFGPWIDAAWALASERPEAAAECPLLHPDLLPERGAAAPYALFEAVRAWLSALSASAPLALLLDDLQWLDPSSSALLQYLLRAPERPFRLVLAGMRSVAAVPDPSLDALLRLAKREGWVESWPIGPLSADDTAALLRLVGSRRDPDEVFSRGAGHPLASLALAMEGEAEGRGRLATLEAMLDERILMAGEEGRGILQWASLLGRGMSPALLETLMDLPVHTLLAALERLEGQGLVMVEEGRGGVEYLFGHDLIRQRVQEGLSGPRLRRMHAHVAQVLKRHPSLSRGAEEVAQHAELGGEWALAAEACLEAGHQSSRLKAFDAATALGLRALDLSWKLEGHWVLRQEICYLLYSVCNALGRIPGGMEEALLRVARAARDADQGETLVAALTGLANLRYEQGRPAEVRDAVLQVAETMGEGVEPGLRAFAMADMALCLLVTDQEIPRARQLLEEADRIMAAHGLDEMVAGMAKGILSFRDGDFPESRLLLERTLARLEKSPLQLGRHLALCELARLEIEAGRPREALAAADRMRACEDDVRHKADVHFPAAITAMALRLQGDPAAAAVYRDALGALRSRDTKVMTAWLLLSWAERDLREGAPGDIGPACREAIERCEPLGRVTEPAWARGLLALSAARGGTRAEAAAAVAELGPALEAALRSSTPLPARISALVREAADALAPSRT